MKDEIKEILNKWKCYIELTKKFTTNDYEMLRVEEINKILDYITNLQEENKRLKEKIEHLLIDLDGESEYKSRNEKAIEYMEQCRDTKTKRIDSRLKRVLNILKGEDNE